MPDIRLGDFVGDIAASPFSTYADAPPWRLTAEADDTIRAAMSRLSAAWRIEDGIARHHSATIETGAIVKPPAIIGPSAFVAATAYLRGGVYLGDGVIVGPACEVKTSFLFRGAKIAHLSFVGDSVIGAGANIEAGAIVANYRNERDDKRIRIRFGDVVIDTGVEKFGAVIGDGSKIGANAVIAPGAILAKSSIVPRLALIDQSGAA